jgi:hypothetical protein
MSEDKSREQFEAWWFRGEIKSPILISEHSMFFADQAWQACSKIKDAEIEQLNTKVAMLRETIDDALGSFKCTQNAQDYPSTHWSNLATKVLSATEADVTKFLNGVRADAVAEYRRQSQVIMCKKVVR